jgi:hypothetical protein
MAFKQVGPEKSGPGQGGPAQFDPKQLRLEKVIPERSDAERDLSQRLKHADPTAAAAKSAAKRHPLGLPSGSVRALLCLIVVAFLVTQTARGVRIDVVWTEALMIMLAHYFTTRRFVSLSNELREKLEAAGEIDPDENPLWLPRHSVRILLIAAFGGLAYYLYAHGRLFDSQALALLVSVGAYLLGITVRGFLGWWSRRTGLTSPAWWIDMKAAGTLLVVLVAVGLQVFGTKEIHGVDAARLQDFSLGLVLYYFGSR